MENKKAKKKGVKTEKNNKPEKNVKSARNSKKKIDRKKRIKAIILMCIALFFFVYMFYAGSTTGSFFALIIGIVCGLVGILYLK
jgi:1,4-dihydroxy-2-naphthoate octaprenyltransferase